MLIKLNENVNSGMLYAIAYCEDPDIYSEEFWGWDTESDVGYELVEFGSLIQDADVFDSLEAAEDRADDVLSSIFEDEVFIVGLDPYTPHNLTGFVKKITRPTMDENYCVYSSSSNDGCYKEFTGTKDECNSWIENNKQRFPTFVNLKIQPESESVKWSRDFDITESKSIKEDTFGYKSGNRYYGGLPNDEDIFDSPQVYIGHYPKEKSKIVDNNDPVAIRKLRQSIDNPLYKLILDETAPENQVEGDALYVTYSARDNEIYLVSEVLLDSDCPDKSTAMSNMKNYLNRIGISFNPQLIEADIDTFDDETYVYSALPLSALSMKSNEDLNKDLNESINESSYKKGDRVELDNGMTGTVTKDFDWENEDQVSVEIDGTGEMRYPRSETLKDLDESKSINDNSNNTFAVRFNTKNGAILKSYTQTFDNYKDALKYAKDNDTDLAWAIDKNGECIVTGGCGSRIKYHTDWRPRIKTESNRTPISSIARDYVEVAYICDGFTNFRVFGGGFKTSDALVSVEDEKGKRLRLTMGDVCEFYTWHDAKGNVIHEPTYYSED